MSGSRAAFRSAAAGAEFEGIPELVASLMRRFTHVSKQENAPECQT
jgi:hypothetical protein